MTSSLTPQINAGYYLTNEGKWLPEREELMPMTIRVQAFEIIRTWLFYSIVKGHYHLNTLPWRDAMISGWGLDAKGGKISKSLGNYEDPSLIVKKYSADALRYWAARGTLGHDLRYDENEVKNGQRLVVKLFNATRFLAINLGEDFERGVDIGPTSPADRYLLANANETIRQCSRYFESYDYANARHTAERFFWDVFCGNYLEMVKFRLRVPEHGGETGPATYSESEIRAGQRVAFDVLYCCIKLFAPFVPFITEHVYQAFFRRALGDDASLSIHLTPWPTPFAGDFTEDFHAGKKIEQVLHVIRTVKANQKMAMGARVGRVVVHGPSECLSICGAFTREIASAVRATEVVFESGEDITADVLALEKEGE
jgi:valyl-tRNA synthetase